MSTIEKEFILVQKKSRGKRRTLLDKGKFLLEKVNSCNAESKTVVSYLTNDAIIRKLSAARDHLDYSGFFSYFQQLVIKSLHSLDAPNLQQPRAPSKIVCFGLGTFSDCIIARYQLALLAALQKTFDIPNVELFDPMFSNQEKEILQNLGFHVLKENEEGKRSVDQNLTLFYLPHCSHQLVNNLLFANWEVQKLRNCIIISNSFKNIHNSVPPRLLSQSLSFISRVCSANICEELEVNNSFEYPDIFNDTSIHIFPNNTTSNRISNANDLFWSERICPVYQDSDFVKSASKE